tara:strand:- start:2471 stop:2809 length:339 start_codon:yes stop_codon:yes gene_type:complete
MEILSYEDFLKVKICVGTILRAEEYNQLKNPSIILHIDFGHEIGIKKSSAQLNINYNVEKLINKQILAVVNFVPKQIGKMVSEVLVLGLPDKNGEPILIYPDLEVKNGAQLF